MNMFYSKNPPFFLSVLFNRLWIIIKRSFIDNILISLVFSPGKIVLKNLLFIGKVHTDV